MTRCSRRSFVAGSLAVTTAGLLSGLPLSAGDTRAARLPARLFEMTLTEARTRKRMKLLRDAMGDRAVALNFMFTGCSSVCPMQSLLLSRTQKLLGAKMGREVVFLSISLSPIGDTPQKLTAYAKAHDAGPGWLFLAGDFIETNRLQKGFDAFEPNRNNHPPVILVGRANSAKWTRLYGMPKPERIASELNAWL
ncbi:SCO family protein [Novosphingobium profundi]|uniref:SCO family protein n=1 Tax=Novosphingobium profundi TaxID=1774954 RepID=UPI001BD9C071|nr:SCO family protein [Novosphingobium profundi]